MPGLFKALVMLVAAMIEKAFFADPNYRPLPRHLVHFSRNRGVGVPLPKTGGAAHDDWR